jgi:hypothetical protein
MSLLARTTHPGEGKYEYEIDDIGIPALHQTMPGGRIETMMLPAQVLWALADQLRLRFGVTTIQEAKELDDRLWYQASLQGSNVVSLPVRA